MRFHVRFTGVGSDIDWAPPAHGAGRALAVCAVHLLELDLAPCLTRRGLVTTVVSQVAICARSAFAVAARMFAAVRRAVDALAPLIAAIAGLALALGLREHDAEHGEHKESAHRSTLVLGEAGCSRRHTNTHVLIH